MNLSQNCVALARASKSMRKAELCAIDILIQIVEDDAVDFQTGPLAAVRPVHARCTRLT